MNLFDKIKESVEPYNLDPKFVYAVAMVESSCKAFLPNGYPTIRFEKHVFLRYIRKTNSELEKEASNIVGSNYQTFQKAYRIHSKYALYSTSFGLFQIMGFNADDLGYANVYTFEEAMKSSEEAQIDAFIRYVRMTNLMSAINNHDIIRFARVYNGPSYAKWHYDEKLRKALASVQ